jgi:hypothetical protein
MRRIILFGGAIAALLLIGSGTWVGIRTSTPPGAVAGSDNAPAMMTGAMGLPTSPYDYYDIVAH